MRDVVSGWSLRFQPLPSESCCSAVENVADARRCLEAIRLLLPAGRAVKMLAAGPRGWRFRR